MSDPTTPDEHVSAAQVQESRLSATKAAAALEAQADKASENLRAVALTAAVDLRNEMAGLAGEMATLAGEMKSLSRYGRRNRNLIRLLAASVIFDVLLSVGFGWLALRAEHASQQATAAAAKSAKIEQVQTTTCQSGNESRAGQLQLWTYILEITAAANPEPTPDQVNSNDEFKAYIASLFAPRDCSTGSTPAPSTPPATN